MKILLITLFGLMSVVNILAQEHQISLITPGVYFVNRAAGFKLNNPSRFQFNSYKWLPSIEYTYRNPQSNNKGLQVSLLWSIQEYPEQSKTDVDSVIWSREAIFLNLSRLRETKNWSTGELSFTYGLSMKYSFNDIHLFNWHHPNWDESIPLDPSYEFSFLGINGGFHLDQRIWRKLYFSSTFRAVIFPIPVSYIGAKLDRYSLWFENGIGIRFGKY